MLSMLSPPLQNEEQPRATYGRRLIALPILPLISSGFAVVILANPVGGSGAVEHFIIGLLVGTMFGHAILAGAWAALGPLAAGWRIPLSLAWVTGLVMALALNIGIQGGPGEVVHLMAACMFSMWLLTTVVLGGVAWWHELAIRHLDMVPSAARHTLQFGIRQLMVLTAVVAVLLAVGRVTVPLLAATFASVQWREAPIFAFLATAGVVGMLPLVLAGLLLRRAGLACIVTLLFIALMTCWELPLMNATLANRGGPEFDHIVWINSTQAAWILPTLGVLRLAGYRLIHRARSRNAR